MSDGNPLDEVERLLSEDKPGEAGALLYALVREGRGGLLARLYLVKTMVLLGNPFVALETARETVSLYPDVAEAAVSLGAVLLELEKLPLAIAEFQRALRLDPDDGDARYFLGCSWLAAGEAARALEAFAVLDANATPGLADRIAEAEAMAVRPRSDAGYVRHLFDQFSTDYDERMLGQLHYQAPQTLRELAGFVIPGRTSLAILDLGCGTGLSGAAFKDRAERLDGVDLSPAMLDKARNRGIYDDLKVADIETGLGNARYDLVVAADTLVYLGDLDPVMNAVGAALKADGFFLFTAEAKPGEGFELGPKRRWRHSEHYLRDRAAAHGFAVAGLMACVPRTEAHEAVNGFAVAFHKPD